MRNKQGKKTSGKKTIMFITIILFMGLMGVGYASWNERVVIKMQIQTGHTKPSFLLKDGVLNYSNGQLELYLSEDGNILYVEGEVSPDFNQDIPIEIVDKGSIPSAFKELADEYDEGISDLKDDLNAHTYRNYGFLEKENIMKSFKLNIGGYENGTDNKEDESYVIYNEDMSDLELQIRGLKDEIDLYNTEKTYNFEYELNFEQDM